MPTRAFSAYDFAFTKRGISYVLEAAHALALGAVLVTNNTKEFKRVKGLKCGNLSIS